MFPFKDIIALFKTSPVAIDNNVFKLHYKVTVILLISFSGFVSARQFFGDPIDCTTLQGGLFNNYLDSYCWFNSYVEIREPDKANCHQLEKFPEKVQRCNYLTDDIRKVNLSYYQWIGIVLMIQTAMFYTPRYLWRFVWEEGRVKQLVNGMKTHVSTNEVKQKQEIVIQYILQHRGRHSSYFVKFIMCEFLNFANVVAQMFITDWFLGNTFLNYGIDWITYNDFDTDEYDILYITKRDRFFPKETECKVIHGSASPGSNDRSTVKCVLPHQVYNEKIYVFLWFYFLILAAITGLFLVFRVATILFPRLRFYLLNKEAILADNDNLTKEIAYNYSIGDWFIIYQMGKNMNPFVFGEVLKNLNDKSFDDEDKNDKMSLY